MKEGRELDDYETEINFEFDKLIKIYIQDQGTNTEYKSKEAQTSTQTEYQEFQVYLQLINECQVSQDQIENQSHSQQEMVQFDERKLNNFLKRIYPQVIEALEESQHLQKLQNFQPISDTSNRITDVLYALTNEQIAQQLVEYQFEITDIQWNSNGMTIAATYGCLEHQGPCRHDSYVSVWNISKRNFIPEQATLTIETPSCVMCLQFHPRFQNIIAIGGFNGVLYIYDISTGQEMAHSEVDDYFHRECITSIVWLQDESILTLGCEGKILIWNPEFQDNRLKYPLKGCYLVRKKESQTEAVGAICIAQSPKDPYAFIIGSEGGSLLKAQITPINYLMSKKSYLDSREKGLSWASEAILFMENLNQKYLPEIKSIVETYCKERKKNQIHIQQICSAKPDIRKMYANPISFAYEAHYGSVFSINFSPFLQNLFITSSLDGQVRIYNIQNPRCLAIYEYIQTYILSAQFSPTRPCVFAACNSLGQVLLFDLMKDTQQYVEKLENDGLSTCALRFNQRQSDLLACSLQGGKVMIYQLSDELSQIKENELGYLRNLMS